MLIVSLGNNCFNIWIRNHFVRVNKSAINKVLNLYRRLDVFGQPIPYWLTRFLFLHDYSLIW